MTFRLRIVQGDDVDIIINVKDKEDDVINLSGVTALTFVANIFPKGSAFIEKSLGDGVTITDAGNGVLKVTLTDTDTSDDNLPAGEYLFELQITDSGGLISTIRDFNDALGCLTVLADLDN